jgi:hypothetical protein
VPQRGNGPPSKTVKGLAGFDDHLTTILEEKRGNSRKLLEIRNAGKTSMALRLLRAFFVEASFSPESFRL